MVDGSYEECVALARAAGERGDTLEIADVGESGPARDVIDGYATLFDEAVHQAEFDVLVVPIGVGSLGAAAARFGARAGIPVVGAEPEDAACLTASLAAGEPTAVPTPGTTMAGLDCAEVSAAAWPDLRAGISGTVTVSDDEAADAQRELEAAGLYIGESGAAPLAALRQGGLGPDGRPGAPGGHRRPHRRAAPRDSIGACHGSPACRSSPIPCAGSACRATWRRSPPSARRPIPPTPA